MSTKVTKGEYKTLKQDSAEKMLYCVDLNASIGFSLIVTGQGSKVGILGIDVPKAELHTLLSMYTGGDGYDSIKVKIIGGDGSNDACKYVEMLEATLKELTQSWNGTLDLSIEVNQTIHPNFITLTGDELAAKDTL